MARKNPIVGTITDPFTGDTADVSRNPKGRLYYSSKSIGIVNPLGDAFQDYMKKNAVLTEQSPVKLDFDDDKSLDPDPQPVEAEKPTAQDFENPPPANVDGAGVSENPPEQKREKSLFERIMGEW